jgi:hypothetical protein
MEPEFPAQGMIIDQQYFQDFDFEVWNFFIFNFCKKNNKILEQIKIFLYPKYELIFMLN